jgi:hypothetical protein
MRRFGLKFSANLMQIDLLLPKLQRFPAAAKGNNFHP